MLTRRLWLGGGAAIGAPVAWLQYNFATEPSKLKPGASVIVVGSGVVGITTAYELARRGFKVSVVEQSDEVCGSQSASWGNAGTLGISKQTNPLSAAPLKIVEQAFSSYKASQSSGAGVFFHPSTLGCPFFWAWGLTFLRASLGGEAAIAHLNAHWQAMNATAQHALFEVAARERLTKAADMRIDGRAAARSVAVSGDAARTASAPPVLTAREPHVHCPLVVDVAVTDTDGQGSCSAFTKGLAAACTRRYGVQIDVGVAARRLCLDDRGRCSGVVLERTGSDGIVHSETREADAVVLCAGACVAPLAATAGVYVPVQPLRGYSLTAKAKAPTLRHHITFAPSSLYATRLGDTLRFTCFGEMAPVCADGPGHASPGLLAALRLLVESEVTNVADLCEWADAREWVGARPLTPDCQPLTGHTRVPGLLLNVGHSFNGWREAVLSAQCLGDVVCCSGTTTMGTTPGGGDATVPAFVRTAFSPQRFQPWAASGPRL